MVRGGIQIDSHPSISMISNLIDQPKFRQWVQWIKQNGWASIAFAGTTKGMTPGQIASLKDIFRVVIETVPKWQFHHEDFPGADVEAHYMALGMKPSAVVVGHPVVYDFRAVGTKGFSVEREVQPKDMRYCEMISESHVLIIAPSPTSNKNFDLLKMYAQRAKIGTIKLPVEERPLSLRQRQQAVEEFWREHPNQQMPKIWKP
jgi:hypothetical protein